VKQTKDSGRRLVFSKTLIPWGSFHITINLLTQTRLLFLLVPLAEVLVIHPLSQTTFLVYQIPYRRCRSIPLGSSPRVEDRGGGFSGYRRKVDSTALPPRKYHRQWKSNKVVKQMVLGSDIGLEETCKMALCGLVGRFSTGTCARKLSLSGWKRFGHHC
jgi:hypothetical protein